MEFEQNYTSGNRISAAADFASMEGRPSGMADATERVKVFVLPSGEVI